MRTLRVLHAISGIDPANGGPTEALLQLAAAQARRGITVRVLSTWHFRDGLDNADTFRAAGVDVTMVGPAKGRLGRHPDLAKAADEAVARADVVQVHSVWQAAQHAAMSAARQRGVPYVVTPCNGLSTWTLHRSKASWLRKQLYLALRLRRNLQGAAAMHYATAAERDATAPLRLTPPVVVEPNGVALDGYDPPPPRDAIEAVEPRLKGRRYLLFVGRIAPEKGLDLLVSAFARYGDEEALLVLAGPELQPEYAASLRRRIIAERLEQRVLLTGLIRGEAKLAAQAHAVAGVLTSYTENFGIAAAESLAAGVPVLVTSGVNLAADVLRGGVGLVVEPSVDTIAAGLRTLLSDPAKRDALAAYAAAFARSRYDWNAIAARWQGHYEQLLAGRKP